MTNQPADTQPAEVTTEPTIEEPANELVVSDAPGITTFRASADLLKYPRHILAKTSRGQRQTKIRIGEKKKGQSYWWVSPHSDFGVPGKTSFDFDYQVLHQKFYEAVLKARQNGHKTAPRYIVVGSLRQIAKELGLKSSNTDDVKKAILANQATIIETGKAIRFTNEKGEIEYLSGQFSAYNVYIRGDNLPDGDEAKKVILELSIPFWQALNTQDFFKPLDGQYFKQLAKPGAQRWYTLVSTDMFVALNKNLPHAKVRYSEYCKFHPQKRHTEFKRMQTQMNTLHQKHVELGYVESPQYQKINTEQGTNDWWILYKPGAKAHEEYKQNRQRRVPKPTPQRELPEQQPDTEALNLVLYFQKQKNNLDTYAPTVKELKQAAELTTKHGKERAQGIVDFAINEMSKTNFKAVFFGAVLRYESQALQSIERVEQQKLQELEKKKAEHEELVQEYQNWLKTTPENRIKSKLEFRITGFEIKHKRPPNEAEAGQLKQELLEAIPTPEEYQKQLFGSVIFTENKSEST